MQSELQRQVNRLREEHIQSSAIHKGAPSLFLSLKEAAAIDISEVFLAAVDSLSELAQYDDRLLKYSSTLFHESSQYLQRELKTAKENKALDKEIESLFAVLSLYADQPSTHRIIEYLIRRFRVHELNVDSLISSLLSQHDSKVAHMLYQHYYFFVLEN
jgi:U3 small nucleolar RNA-associated protein 10